MGATLYDRPTGPLNEADIAGAGDTRYQRLSAPDPGILWGCIMSTAGASTTLTVSAGYAVDSTNVLRMRLASAMAKTTSAWAAGTAAGGLDTGAIANSTWYHWFVIYNPTTLAVDVVFSATATPAAGPTTMPSGYTLFRRIGSMKTNGSAQWTSFVQWNDEFTWVTPVQEINVNSSSTAITTRTLPNLPPNITVLGALSAYMQDSTTGPNASCFIMSMDATSISDPNFGVVITTTALTIVGGGSFRLKMINQQCKTANQSAGANVLLRITTMGWVDDRGKLS